MRASLSYRSPIVIVSSVVFAIVLAIGFSAQFGQAGGGSDGSVFVPVEPVRLLDTRENLGLEGQFTSATPRSLQITGGVPSSAGTFEIPGSASAIAINVTAVRPSARGFISVRPGDAEGTPETANLNFAAGEVVPNKVDVKLGPDGSIQLWFQGAEEGATIDVVVDLVGYYDEHHHDDRYYTETEVDAKVGAVSGEVETVTGVVDENASAIQRLEGMKVVAIDHTIENASYTTDVIELVPDFDLHLICTGGASPEKHVGWDSSELISTWTGNQGTIFQFTMNTLWLPPGNSGFDFNMVGTVGDQIVTAEVVLVGESPEANRCDFRGTVTLTAADIES